MALPYEYRICKPDASAVLQRRPNGVGVSQPRRPVALRCRIR